jgi:DNA-binding winged helix-turn-helix (wHTH) protein
VQYDYEVLHLLVRRPNVTLSKDVLTRAGWHDVVVGDNSLEKLVSKLRRHLDDADLNSNINAAVRGISFRGHGGDPRVRKQGRT